MPERPQDPRAEPQQPQQRHNPLIKPFVVLALPGMYLFYKYNQYRRKRKENATRRLAERELQHLNSKIGVYDIVYLYVYLLPNCEVLVCDSKLREKQENKKET